jgi:hypothetical protein
MSDMYNDSPPADFIFASKKEMKKLIIFASMAIAAGLTLTNIYTSLVDVPSWGSNIPGSIATAREYFKVSDPGNFFRIFSPLNQGLGLACVILFWKRNRQVRWLLVTAFLLYMTAEGMTFEYFYPRNDIMFKSMTSDVAQLKTIWLEWRSMNWLRTAIVAAGFICSATALHFSYSGVTIRKRDRQGVTTARTTEVA